MNETITRYQALPKAHRKHVDFMYGGLDYWTIPDAFKPGEVLRFIVSLENELDNSLDTNVFGETVKSKARDPRASTKHKPTPIERLTDFELKLIQVENGGIVEYQGVECRSEDNLREVIREHRLEMLRFYGRGNRRKI